MSNLILPFVSSIQPLSTERWVGIPQSLWAGSSGDRILVGARYSAPVKTGPGTNPATYTRGTGSFPGVKRPRLGVDHPPSSSAEVKERVELYLYSSMGLRDLSWSKLFLCVYCTLRNFQTEYGFYQIPKECLILRLVHDMKCRFTKICNFYLSHLRYDNILDVGNYRCLYVHSCQKNPSA